MFSSYLFQQGGRCDYQARGRITKQIFIVFLQKLKKQKLNLKKARALVSKIIQIDISKTEALVR